MTQVLDRLRELVDGYFARHPKASVPSLAKEAGIGASTLRRILQGESKATFETAWSILSVTCETETELLAATRELFPEASKALKAQFDNDSWATPTSILRDIVRTRAGFIVVNMASMDCGIDRETAVRLAGFEGRRVIEKLLEHGIAHEKENKIRMHPFAHLDPRMLLDQIAVASEVFDATLAGTPACGAMLKTASVSTEALAEVKEELKRFVSRVMEIVEIPSNRGEHPLFVTAMMNLFDSESFSQGGSK